MNGGQEIAGELVVSSGDPAKILETAEAALDDVSSLVGPLVEGVDDDAVGFVGNNRLCVALDDLGAQVVAVVALVGDERAHGWGERQNIGRGGNVGVLARGQMKNDWPAERIAQRMDLGRAAAARTADGLSVLPPFPPEAQR
jgi:hypothetical protein